MTTLVLLLCLLSPQDTCHHQWEQRKAARIIGFAGDKFVIDTVLVPYYKQDTYKGTIYTTIKCTRCKKIEVLSREVSPSSLYRKAWFDSVNAVIDSVRRANNLDLEKPK